MALDCITDMENVGASACKQFPQAFESFIKTGLDFEMPVADMADPTKWQDAILAGKATRIYLFPLAYDFENVSEEAQRASSNLGKEVTTRLGQYRFRSLFRENLEMHQAMYSHLGSAGRLFPIDIAKKLMFTSDDGGVTGKGFTLDQFMPEKIQFGTGSEPSLSPIYYTLANSDELDVNGYQIKFNAQLLAIKALVDVKLTASDTSATGFTITVKSIYDNVGVNGLVTADFVKTGGVASAVFGTPAGNGVYPFTGVGLTSGTVDLRAANLLTVKAYESNGPVTVTIA